MVTLIEVATGVFACSILWIFLSLAYNDTQLRASSHSAHRADTEELVTSYSLIIITCVITFASYLLTMSLLIFKPADASPVHHAEATVCRLTIVVKHLTEDTVVWIRYALWRRHILSLITDESSRSLRIFTAVALALLAALALAWFAVIHSLFYSYKMSADGCVAVRLFPKLTIAVETTMVSAVMVAVLAIPLYRLCCCSSLPVDVVARTSLGCMVSAAAGLVVSLTTWPLTPSSMIVRDGSLLAHVVVVVVACLKNSKDILLATWLYKGDDSVSDSTELPVASAETREVYP